MLEPGTELGPYVIEAPIGAGGMGAVYRARDTRLDRTVAIKTVEGRFSERFEREAKTIASLNHLNVCTLFDVGANYLVMEYIDGRPLKGPVALDEVIRLGIQIAEGLDAAHRRGITHRDLKPGNILVTKAGVVKVIDFGLAKSGPVTRGENDATLTLPLTGDGMILGTVPYMSPEQLQGEEADPRSDIFALGCVLYELLTGRRAFDGKTQVSIMAAILEHEPPALKDLQPVTPEWLDRLIRRCLRKKPEARWQSAGDIANELREPPPEAVAAPPPPPPPPQRAWIGWAVAAVCAIAAIGAAVTRPGAAPVPVRIVDLESPPGAEMTRFSPSISPDGRTVAAAHTAKGVNRVYLRPLDAPEWRALEGTEGALTVFWSPDSRSVGYTSTNGLYRVDLPGGAVRRITSSSTNWASWGSRGVILFTSERKIRQVPEDGGPDSPVDLQNGTDTGTPHFLPDGQHFLYAGGNAGRSVTRLGGGDGQPLKIHPGTVYAPGPKGEGYLVFFEQGQLLARAFDTASLRLQGPAVPLTGGDLVTGVPSASKDGTVLVTRWVEPPLQLAWLDASGRPTEPLGDPGRLYGLSLSPSGKKAAYARGEPGDSRIFLYDFERGVESRLTTRRAGSGQESSPVWSADEREIIYYHRGEVLRRPADGSGTDQKITGAERRCYPTQWLRDGKGLLCATVDFFHLSLEPGSTPVRLSDPAFSQGDPQASFDNQWLAYSSIESGEQEIYIRSAPKEMGGARKEAKYRVSSDGGRSPRWRGDGHEIYYISRDRQMMAATVDREGEGLRIGVPRRLFALGTASTNMLAPYDVTADGKRFLMLLPAGEVRPRRVSLILNWWGLLDKTR